MNSHKHPISLPIFFSTEMWERYGFYVIQTLLALFLVYHYHLSDAVTYSTVGTFTALTYISPIIGGVIADKWIGQKNAVLLGAMILLLNYVLLALSSTILFLYITLGGIAVGTGLLKPNISSLLGRQYAEQSELRDKGFVIFYSKGNSKGKTSNN